MKHFESSGVWHPAGETAKAVGGVLRFDEKGFELELFGAFQEGWSFEQTRQYPKIHGVISHNPYGRFVTLFDSFTISHTSSSVGLSSEKLLCKLAAIGNTHIPEEIFAKTLILKYTYFIDWVGLTGFNHSYREVDGVQHFEMLYTKPAQLTFALGNGAAVIGYDFKSSQGIHNCNFSENAAIAIDYPVMINAKTMLPNFIDLIQNFISFATDTPNAIDRINLVGEPMANSEVVDLSVIYDALVHLPEKKSFLISFDMLFTLQDCQQLNLDVLQSWFKFTKRFNKFVQVYFKYEYAKPEFLSDRFIAITRAFCHLNSVLMVDLEPTTFFLEDLNKTLVSHYSREEQDLLLTLLPKGYEFELPVRLLKTLQDNSRFINKVIIDFDDFVRSFVLILDQFSRRPHDLEFGFTDTQIFYVIEKIQMLIKILVLKELGFSGDSLVNIISRNSRINFLKTI